MSAVAEILAQATNAQRQAADPVRNAFVSANAGSGKTKVLVDRVIALLLAGAAPDHIVCLTYTKAAASEMRARLFQRLGGWAVAEDAALARQLSAAGFLDEEAAGAPARLARARALFAQALETPGGLRIQTIHAFCERLLRRFPLEAGLDAGFEVMDEADAKRLAAQASAQAAAFGEDAARVADAHALLAAEVSEQDVDRLIAWIQNNASTLERHFAAPGGVEAACAALCARLEVEPGETPDSMKAAAWADADHAQLEAAAYALRDGSKTDAKRADALFAALNAEAPEAAFEAYLAALFTQKGEGDPLKPKSLVTKATAAAAPLVAPFLEREIGRLSLARERARAAHIAALSQAGLTLAHAFVSAYARLKRRAGAVDFADLIARTLDLVSRSDAAAWVLYKLDGRIDHVLVDEAQDTAPEQWSLIQALTAEFTAGAGARAEAALRTLFAVGDEKQSIYSFQGAAPERFLEAGQEVSRHAPERFVAPALQVSFRSAPAVLESVDAVFSTPDAAEALTPKGDIPRHMPVRDDVRGRVELWPLMEKAPAVEEPDPWTPVDAPEPDDPEDRLARAIAQTIADGVARGEAVSVRGPDNRWVQRAMRPGDVMILLRRRARLFDQIIRRLKGAGVAVAGADRLVLSDHAAVEDVLGAARVGLLPQDDLAVAELLKSPLLHPVGQDAAPVDEKALFALAHGREGALCDAVAGASDPRLAEACALLEDLRQRARTEGPYAFVSGLLDRASATGESYAQRLAHRLGPECEDPLRELLNLAMAHEQTPAPSLERFVRETLFDRAQTKRDGAEERDEVRVMTVHGAKGLEAPVVFLPDAAEAARSRQARVETGLFADAHAGLVWSPRKPADPPAAAALRDRRAAAAEAEDLRLLYVAMTRAQDRLIVCGADGQQRGAPESWWGRVETGLAALGAETVETPAGEGAAWGDAPALMAGKGAEAPRAAEALHQDATPSEIPAWAMSAAPPAPLAVQRVTPSALVASKDPHPVLSPLWAVADADGRARDRFQRGRWIHRLLEVLPDLPPTEWAAAGARLLANEGAPAADHADLLAEVTAVLTHPEFAPVFAPGSQAEAAVAGSAPGLPEGLVIDGRIDRLAVTQTEVLIVDFKTDRPPPEDATNVGGAYLAQLAAYRAIMATLHPDKTVRCALLWTYTPALMPIANTLLDNAPALA